MGIFPKNLAGKLKDAWRRMGKEAHAVGDLQDAITAHDQNAALSAISHARPGYVPREDSILGLIGAYSRQKNHDPDFLKAMRTAVYTHFDPKITKAPWREGRDDNARDANRTRTGFENPHYAYAFALYMNDKKTMRKLFKSGIHPDNVSEKPVRMAVVMAAIHRGNFDAMKEALRQGASIDRAYGIDDFPPVHSFSKPLFLQLNEGVTDALLETGNARIIEEVHKGLQKIQRRKNSRFRLT